jgi:hypothetical protein
VVDRHNTLYQEAQLDFQKIGKGRSSELRGYQAKWRLIQQWYWQKKKKQK